MYVTISEVGGNCFPTSRKKYLFCACLMNKKYLQNFEQTLPKILIKRSSRLTMYGS
jgi:hypothetical protein